jgi:hypothetical protein
MTAPTHTRAEVEQLAAAYDIFADKIRKHIADEAEQNRSTSNLEEHLRERITVAHALRQLAASIGAEPVAWTWSQLMLDSQGGWEQMTELHRPGTWIAPERIRDLRPLYAAPAASPTYREGELSGIEKAAPLRRAGAQLSNAAFNLAQGGNLPFETSEQLRGYINDWDAAVSALAKET